MSIKRNDYSSLSYNAWERLVMLLEACSELHGSVGCEECEYMDKCTKVWESFVISMVD